MPNVTPTQLQEKKDVKSIDGHQLNLTKFRGTGRERFAFLPSGNEWIAAVTNTDRSKQNNTKFK